MGLSNIDMENQWSPKELLLNWDLQYVKWIEVTYHKEDLNTQ